MTCHCARCDVSIHAPARGRDSHAHRSPPGPDEVSIHAPARGRDPDPQMRRARIEGVSIHAPARGRDPPLNVLMVDTLFQSTRPRVGATHARKSDAINFVVSIHAPARGRDALGKRIAERVLAFQSTRPRVGATSARNSLPLVRCFNPRARAWARLPSRQPSITSMVSIHAPARGRDSARRGILGDLDVSIHAPARGRDGCNAWWSSTIKVSIHAPARGRDDRRLQRRHRRAMVSIHAPARGRDLKFLGRPATDDVSIHAPARGRDAIRASPIFWA